MCGLTNSELVDCLFGLTDSELVDCLCGLTDSEVGNCWRRGLELLELGLGEKFSLRDEDEACERFSSAADESGSGASSTANNSSSSSLEKK